MQWIRFWLSVIVVVVVVLGGGGGGVVVVLLLLLCFFFCFCFFCCCCFLLLLLFFVVVVFVLLLLLFFFIEITICTEDFIFSKDLKKLKALKINRIKRLTFYLCLCDIKVSFHFTLISFICFQYKKLPLYMCSVWKQLWNILFSLWLLSSP